MHHQFHPIVSARLKRRLAQADCRAPTAEGLVFADLAKAKAAVAAYDSELGLPNWAEKPPHLRSITLKPRKGGGLLAEFKFKEEIDDEDGRDVEAVKAGWTKARGPVWAKVIDVDTDGRQTPYESLADNAVRQVSLKASTAACTCAPTTATGTSKTPTG